MNEKKKVFRFQNSSFSSSLLEEYRFQKLAPEMKWKEIKEMPQSVKMLNQKKTENKYHCGWYVVQLSTQHNPFWPSLDLERKKFDQPHSVQRSTAVPQARREDLQEKIDDW
jgi:hypothetical protein